MVRNGQKQEKSAETFQETNDHTNYGPEEWMSQGAPYIDVQLLTPNEYSRPQLPLNGADYIAIHYTANPGATAQNNRDYFENLSISHEAKVSSHFVVGLEGEVIQCIPTSEMSYATNSRNVDSISIECCHKDDTGVFEQETYDSVVKLAAWLCARFGLTSEQVIRHYDVTGKECPKYYVDHPDAWEQMKADISAQITSNHKKLLFIGNVPRGVFCEQSSQKTRESQREIMRMHDFCASRKRVTGHSVTSNHKKIVHKRKRFPILK